MFLNKRCQVQGRTKRGFVTRETRKIASKITLLVLWTCIPLVPGRVSRMELGAKKLFKLFHDLHHTLPQGPTPPSPPTDIYMGRPPEYDTCAGQCLGPPLRGRPQMASRKIDPPPRHILSHTDVCFNVYIVTLLIPPPLPPSA